MERRGTDEERAADVMLSFLLDYVTVGLTAWMVAALVQYLWRLLKISSWSRLPPGPRGLPFLGYLPFVSKIPCQEVEALREKYGNVFGLYVGSRYLVFLCDIDTVKKTLSMSPLMNRPDELPLKIKPHAQSLIVSNGPVWATQRQFTQKMFKKLGVGSQALDDRIHEELSHLVRHLASRSGSPVALGDVLTPGTSNILRALLMGHRLEYDDPKRARADQLLKVVQAASIPFPAIYLFPWVSRTLSFLNLGPCGWLRSVIALRDRLSEMQVDAHKRTYQDGMMRDYIDGFLSEMAAQQGKKEFSRKFLIGNVGSLFSGGSGSIRTMLEWLLLMCVAKSDMQRRVQDEIDGVLGETGEKTRVSWGDRGMMPYTQAFIWETMRYRPQNPLGVMRRTSADVIISGYSIPRGTIVVPSFWSIFHDRAFWGDPDVFRPERFLTDGETVARKPERLLPFSYGKRKCPAEVIARMATFASFTTILQHFNIEEPSDQHGLASGANLSISLRVTNQKVVFRPRKVVG